MEDEKQNEDVESGETSSGGKKQLIMPNLPKQLSLEEKKYLLAIERGDFPNVRRLLQKAQRKKTFNINCVDSLGRGALTIAIDQESLEMVELLVVMGVKTKDALLHAINVEFVEAVELLLEHEELIHKEGEPYSWQLVDINAAMFTPDITPLILAAHRNNYEILKILLDRGAAIPMPHDIKCGCDDCIKQTEEDSLRHSLSRLNEYRALASPSLIALSSSDPLLTAFQLSWELRNLAFAEPECKADYMELRSQCQKFAVDLLHQSRSSQELAIILNHDPDNPPYEEGEHMKLARLELAILYKQKKFVAHPNIQQLLAALWYEGVPGFRRKSSMQKVMITVKVALLFPLYCVLYMLAPETKTGKLMRKPFMKFLIHASSYLFFLLLLILVSLRAEDLFFEYFGTESMRAYVIEKYEKQRGSSPNFLEYAVCIYVVGFIVEETQEIFNEGIKSYLRNLWNFIDFTRNLFYTLTFCLRVVAYIQQTNEIKIDPATAYIRREQWNAFDPQLIAEGLFAAANIFSALKLVHLFSINPHLGPLQISLGRMVIDIVKFFFIYSLVLFAFACGLNQLLWYFSDLEKQKCYHLPNGEPDFDNAGDSCMKWRRFANVFESSQTLFWASFGMVDLNSFELTGIRTYTRFWGLLMFGSYSVINVIVLLNLLIAMMSNSYAMIEEHSDTEWKFARTKLWLSYFEESGTLPPPFNIFPKPKYFFKLLGLRKKDKLKRMSTKRRNREEKERDYRYTAVMRALVWRYVSAMHRKCDESEVTEDDINELKSDVSSFRYELLDVLSKNGMDTSSVQKKEKAILGKRMKVWERRLMKDFKVAPVAIEENEDLFAPPPDGEGSLARFRRVARQAALDSNLNKWKQVVKGAQIASQIGRCHTRDSFKKQQNLQKAMDEARRLAAARSRESSRSTTPMELPDFSGSELIKLVRDDVQGSTEPPKKRVTLSVTSSGKPQPLSPSISIIPPPKSPVRAPSPRSLDISSSSEKVDTDAPDLINLESPVASLKRDNRQSFTEDPENVNSIERDIFSTPEGTTSPVESHLGQSPKMTTSPSRSFKEGSPKLQPPPELEKFRASPPPQPPSRTISVSPSRSIRASPSPSLATKSEDRSSSPGISMEEKLRTSSPSTSTDPRHPSVLDVETKASVSALRLKFEIERGDVELNAEDQTEDKDRTPSSGEDSEDKESCDELQRIISSEGTEDTNDFDEKRSSNELESKVEGKISKSPEKIRSPSPRQACRKSPSILEGRLSTTGFRPVSPAVISPSPMSVIDQTSTEVVVEMERHMLQEPPHLIERPLTPQPETPPRVPTPLRQRNIERIPGKSQPKYGWL